MSEVSVRAAEVRDGLRGQADAISNLLTERDQLIKTLHFFGMLFNELTIPDQHREIILGMDPHRSNLRDEAVVRVGSLTLRISHLAEAAKLLTKLGVPL
jgi:hypothetical protein